MSNRHEDWLRQAEADLRHARNALEDGDHEWACFAAQQAAELRDAGRRLDKHYIPTRYPNGFDTGAPTDYYTAAEAEEAITDANAVLEFSRGSMG